MTCTHYPMSLASSLTRGKGGVVELFVQVENSLIVRNNLCWVLKFILVKPLDLRRVKRSSGERSKVTGKGHFA